MNTETIILEGEKIKFKEGALRKQMKLKKDEKLNKNKLNKIAKTETNKTFNMFGREYKATPLLKKRANFALVLMGKK